MTGNFIRGRLDPQMTGRSRPISIYMGQGMSEWTSQRNTVFLDRYAAKDKQGKPIEETPRDMWARVANAIANGDNESFTFYKILEDFKFVPGGRILTGAGTGTEQTYYNCYVIPVESASDAGNDSREAIFDTIKTAVDILSRGGGVGINWSVLRPAGSYLSRISGTSSGPIGWMDVASTAVGEVMQGGSRRGAAMFMLDDWHPDIIDNPEIKDHVGFINAKRNLSKITNANVSVAVSDEFMEAVKNDGEWRLRFPDTTHPAYNAEWDGDLPGWESKGYPVVVHRTVRAREVWRNIAESAWDNGEPGVVFLDRYNKESTGRDVERIIAVNPCGEQGLGAYSVCNLGSMNLDAYIRKVGNVTQFDWDSFEQDVRTAVRFLDNVIDKTFYWDERTKNAQENFRRIGLGVMGLADALIRLGLRYGSPEAVAFTEDIFRTMKDEAIYESMALADEKGAAGAWNDSMWDRPFLAEFADRHPGFDFRPLRNLFLLTQAPTGTTSILAGVNSGIEPYFAFSYTRKDRTGTHQVRASILNEIPQPAEGEQWDYVVSAQEVTVEEHVAMQAAVQRYVDSSVSKTINAPNSHTVEDVERAYTLAYESGLKGIAYFRDGCGRMQVLSTQPEQQSEVEKLQKELFQLRAKMAAITHIVNSDGTASASPTLTLVKPDETTQDPLACPSCGVGTVVFEEGCKKCHSCAWAAC